MSLEYIRDTYRVPAKIGGAVEYSGAGAPRVGVITGADGAHLIVRLAGEVTKRRFHPTWAMRYLDDADTPKHEASQ